MCNTYISTSIALSKSILFQPLKNEKFVLPKSRYDCIDMYISPAGEKCNDQKVIYEQEHLNLLLEAGIQSKIMLGFLNRCLNFRSVNSPIVMYALLFLVNSHVVYEISCFS